MADLSLYRRGGAFPARNLAIAISAAGHLLVFLALFWKFGASPGYPPAPIMSVQLTQPWWEKPQGPAPVRPAPSKPARAPSAADLPVLSQPAPSPHAIVAVPKPPDGADEALPLHNALRRGLGCDQAALLGLSRAEREACLDRLAKAQEASGPYRLNLDRRGAFARKDIEPFLARKPKNGCVPSVTEKGIQTVGQAQQKQDWTTGIKCAWSF